MGEAERLWSTCTDALRAQVPDAIWVSCFQPTRAVAIHDGALVVAVPSSVVKERIENRFAGEVSDALVRAGRPDVEVVLDIRPESASPELFPGAGSPDVGPDARLDVEIDLRDPMRSTGAVAPAAVLAPPAVGRPERPERPERSRTASINPRYTFDAFVTGASNRFAHAAALAVAERPARSYNPLFIYGVAGLGKTHLLHAIAHYVQENYPAYPVRYVSCEAFMNDFVEAIRTNAGPAFKKRYRENDVLLVDDIQFLEGKEGLQEEFFHTFNELHGGNRQIVLSSDRPPRAIATLEDRLRGRFEWGLITDIQPPDLETRLAILRKKAEREPAETPPEVLEFIADNITNNIRELEGALIRVSAFASLNRAPVTVELAAEVLRDVLTDAKPRAITAEVILETTAKQFSFSIEELKGQSRRRPLVTARQIGMYVCREMTDLSYPAIARVYGGRDHTTVIHAVDKVGTLMAERREIYDQVTELMQTIRSSN